MVAPLFPVTLSGVTVRRRGRVILGPVDLTLGATGLTIVIGPNGSGKTTLLRAIHGVERLSAGQIGWGVPQEEARARQAYVFQAPIMLRRSVAENLAYPLQLARVPRTERAARVADWAARIGLAAAQGMPATRLSGGERQKLALARALIGGPDLLFLDEPCANLDGRATREIEALLLATQAAGTRIVMATHDFGQARRLATDTLFIFKGRVHERGPTVLTDPQTPELAAFLKGDILE